MKSSQLQNEISKASQVLTQFGKTVFLSKYLDETGLLPERNNAMVLKFAAGVVAIVNQASLCPWSGPC